LEHFVSPPLDFKTFHKENDESHRRYQRNYWKGTR
jgi:hypothetical protein